MEEWKRKAKILYFEKHLSINDTASAVGRTRQTVSVFLKSCREWEEEQETRKKKSAERRKKQQRIWDSIHRVTRADVQRDHFTAVAELSREKYH